MKICSMTASFGCLSHETLTAEPGVNLFVRCNEQGKSTWAAFVFAMFYGIDSSERAAKGRLPAKTKYLPWNGAPMEGTLVLEHQGRQIVLERTSVGSRPMTAFRAWDKTTGQALPDWTGETCGQLLLGVERDVYRRTAFLSGQELQVNPDADLSRRLAALAASGRQEDSFPAAMERLKAEKNRLRYHKTGLIPEAEQQLRQIHDTLSRLEQLRQQRMSAENIEDPEPLLRQEQAAWEARKAQERDTLLQLQEAEAALSARAASLPDPRCSLHGIARPAPRFACRRPAFPRAAGHRSLPVRQTAFLAPARCRRGSRRPPHPFFRQRFVRTSADRRRFVLCRRSLFPQKADADLRRLRCFPAGGDCPLCGCLP